jgi:hypothetical protein
MASICGIIVRCVICRTEEILTGEKMKVGPNGPVCKKCFGPCITVSSFIAKVASPRRTKR